MGQKVKSFERTDQLVWDGRNERGLTVATGMKIIRMKAGDYINYKKMLLLK
jgi:hypothetical protein